SRRRSARPPPPTPGTFFPPTTRGPLPPLLSPPLAARIGLVRTMVYTHIPANLLLATAGLVPSAPVAVACLLVRAALSQMDVPPRQALVMGRVPPDDRAAGASLTSVQGYVTA